MIRAGEDFAANLSTGLCYVVIGDYLGLALSKEAEHLIVQPKNVNGKEYMDSVCHELLHIVLPDANEREVERLAGDITEVLWKRGYRLPKAKKKHDPDS